MSGFLIVSEDEPADNDVPPFAYGNIYGEIHDDTDGLGTTARTTDDGRVSSRINHFSLRASQVFTPAL